MNISLETYEQIEQYLKGTLSDTERTAFLKQMEGDALLSQEVEMQQLLNDLVLEKGLADIRNKVGEDLSGPAPSSVRETVLLCAGLLLLGLGVFYYSLKNTKEKISLRSTQEIKEKNPAPSEVGPAQHNPVEIRTNKKKNIHIPGTSQKEDPAVENNEVAAESIPLLNESEEEVKPAIESPVPLTEHTSKEAGCPEIIFGVQSQPTCKGKETGVIQIVVSSIKGGQQPYSYSIAGKEFNLESVNTNLPEGNFTVEIKDHKGCISQKQVHVSGKSCTQYKDYSFNPNSETWKLPFADHESGTISIADKSGRLVYTAKIENGTPYEWNGISTNGEVLKTGTYLYIAQSENGEIRQGYITILH